MEAASSHIEFTLQGVFWQDVHQQKMVRDCLDMIRDVVTAHCAPDLDASPYGPGPPATRGGGRACGQMARSTARIQQAVEDAGFTRNPFASGCLLYLIYACRMGRVAMDVMRLMDTRIRVPADSTTTPAQSPSQHRRPCARDCARVYVLVLAFHAATPVDGDGGAGPASVPADGGGGQPVARDARAGVAVVSVPGP